MQSIFLTRTHRDSYGLAIGHCFRRIISFGLVAGPSLEANQATVWRAKILGHACIHCLYFWMTITRHNLIWKALFIPGDAIKILSIIIWARP